MIHVDSNLYRKIQTFVNDRMGLNFSDNRKQDLIRGLNHASETFGYKDINTCIKQLISINWSANQIQTLASYLTVGETFFYRHKEQIDYIFNVFLSQKELLSQKKIKIWSAACCTGEEAYTFAILFKEMFSKYKQWNIEIIGTDINPVFLKKAQSGIYTEYSFRKLSDKLKDKYFKKTAKNRYEISDSIKNMVTFKYLNLASNTYPAQINNTANIDIIFCRNVFIYFQQDTIDKVISRYKKCLSNNGILIVSPAETFMISHKIMNKEHYANPTVFSKNQNKHQTAPRKVIDIKKIEQLLKEIKIAKPVKTKKSIPQKPLLAVKEVVVNLPINKINELNTLFKTEKYSELLKIINYYDLIKVSKPNHIFLLNLLVKCHRNLNNSDKALDYCEKYVELGSVII
jgi:chemotaxis protein methyltransferase CheR